MTARDELDMDRDEALRVPCRYRLPDSELSAKRRASVDPDDQSVYCGAKAGEPCRSPRSGLPMRRWVHLIRAQEAGVAWPSTVPARSDPGSA